MMLGFPNRADAATLSGGSWSSGLPRSNLQNRVLSKVARTTDDANASTKFDIDLGQDRAIKIVALIKHNLSTSSKYRVRSADANTFAVLTYDSGWIDVWPSVYDPLTLEWEDDNFWDGLMTAEERAGYPAALIHLPTGSRSRYWRVELDDTSNPDGYVEIGRLFIGEAWQPSRNYSFGHSVQFESRTEVVEAQGGVEYFNEKKPFRVTRLSLDAISESEALMTALEMQRKVDVSKEVMFIHNPDDLINRLRRSYLARLRQISPIEQRAYNLYKTPYELKEIL